MRSFRYAATLRPVTTCTLPEGVEWRFDSLPWDSARTDLPRSNYRYGVICTDRALTHDERERFGFVPV